MLGVRLVVGRRGRTGEVENGVESRARAAQPSRKGIDDVGFKHVEMRLALQMAQILPSPGAEVVKADDVSALREEGVAQVRTKESRSASDKDEPASPVLHGRFLRLG
jgi:hypothetical protein